MNRYDLFQASATQVDPKDNQPWPDPLSKNFSKFTFKTPPLQYSVDDTFLTSPFLVSYAIYKLIESNPKAINAGCAISYDDIILQINNIPHISLLELDSVIKFPDRGDIISFSARVASNVS